MPYICTTYTIVTHEYYNYDTHSSCSTVYNDYTVRNTTK